MNRSRSTKALVVPALLATFALSACQDSAPTAAPPTSPTSSAAQTVDPDATSEATSAPAESPSEDSGSASPEESGSGEESGKACKNESTYRMEKEEVEAKPLNTTQRAKADIGRGEAEISFGEPTIDTAGGDNFFPGDGMQTVIYPVTLKMVASEGAFITTKLAFGMVDKSDEACQPDTLSKVMKPSDQLSVTTLKPGDSISKKVAFAVPAGAKLEDYALLFNDNYASGEAALAWKAK
ncbi:hypothetical protein [Demetria terragena]|uniref:hypothetical protein n=1 Tax=Demetria terragena TaxID=63959 RepID=UPI000376B069|nr:hypothetical protein [Demetria terragena]